MSPAPPPRPPGKPGGPGAPKPQPPRRPPEPEHPAEKLGAAGVPGQPTKAGKYFEIRKGKSGSHEALKDEEEPIMDVALPRSITQEQEQADLKARLGREELVDIDKRNSLVKVKDTVSEPASLKKRSSQIWLLILVILFAVGAFLADKYHLLDKLKGH